MNKATQLKIDVLSRAQWFNPPVAIVPVWNAYNESHSGQSLMFVTWWGSDENPHQAGFTRFSWDYDKGLPLTDDGREWFDILARELLEGTNERITHEKLHRDDVVLIYPEGAI